jgi:hypothetical protein
MWGATDDRTFGTVLRCRSTGRGRRERERGERDRGTGEGNADGSPHRHSEPRNICMKPSCLGAHCPACILKCTHSCASVFRHVIDTSDDARQWNGIRVFLEEKNCRAQTVRRRARG